MQCTICETIDDSEEESGGFDKLIDAGWIPSYWDGDKEKDGPVCPTCVEKCLRFNTETGDYELSPIGRESLRDSRDVAEPVKAESERRSADWADFHARVKRIY